MFSGSVSRVGGRMELATWLQQRLDGRSWNQSDLARALGVPPGTVQRWTKGTIPRPEMIERIADVFAFDTKTLLQIAGYIEDDADDPEERSLVSIYRALPEEERKVLMEFARWRAELERRRG